MGPCQGIIKVFNVGRTWSGSFGKRDCVQCNEVTSASNDYCGLGHMAERKLQTDADTSLGL